MSLPHLFFFVIIRRPPGSTRTDTLFPYTTLFRSGAAARSLEVSAGSVPPRGGLRLPPPDSGGAAGHEHAAQAGGRSDQPGRDADPGRRRLRHRLRHSLAGADATAPGHLPSSHGDRKSVGLGKRVTLRVNLGGRV